jgi:hypothetical protein
VRSISSASPVFCGRARLPNPEFESSNTGACPLVRLRIFDAGVTQSLPTGPKLTSLTFSLLESTQLACFQFGSENPAYRLTRYFFRYFRSASL